MADQILNIANLPLGPYVIIIGPSAESHGPGTTGVQAK